MSSLSGIPSFLSTLGVDPVSFLPELPPVELPEAETLVPLPAISLGLLQTAPTDNFTPGQQAAPYLKYDVRTKYIYDSGNLMLSPAYDPDSIIDDSLAGGEQEAVFIQATAPVAYRVTTFQLVRSGTECVPPDPNTQPNEVLLKAQIEQKAPIPSSDGSAGIWQMAGFYFYGLVVPGTSGVPSTVATLSVPQYGA